MQNTLRKSKCLRLNWIESKKRIMRGQATITTYLVEERTNTVIGDMSHGGFAKYIMKIKIPQNCIR